MVLPIFLLTAGPERIDLLGFSLTPPSNPDWRTMTRGPDSVWFHRAISRDEFSMIGVLAIKIAKSKWAQEDRPIAEAIIREYRESSAAGGAPIKDEDFSVETVNGKVFFAGKASLPAVHAQPVDPSYRAREQVYVHIAPRGSSEEPHLFFFVFTDVRRREVPFEEDLAEFVGVLESLRVGPSAESG